MLLLALAGAAAIIFFLNRPAAWTDDWTPPPGFSDMLSDLSAGRADDGQRRMEEIFHKHRSPVWRGRAALALGMTRLRRREFTPAGVSLAEAQARGGPAAPFAAVRRAEALIGSGKAREAMELLDKTRPGTADPVLADDAAIARARALAASGNASRARQDLVAFAGSSACAEPGRVLDAAAKIAEQSGDRAAAADLYRRLYLEQPRSKEAAQALDHLTSLDPRRFRADDLPAIARRAQAQIKAGDGKGSLATWDLAIMAVPIAGADPRWRLDIAEAAIEARQLDRALRLLGRPPVRKGDSRRGWLLGRALCGIDHNAEGIACLRAAAAGTDRYAQSAQYLLATVLDQTNHDREALDQFQIAVRRFPGDERSAPAMWRAAWLSYRLTRRDQAARLFEQLLGIKQAAAYIPSATYWLGRTREGAGQRALAIDAYSKLTADYARDYYGLLAADRLEGLGAPGRTTPSHSPSAAPLNSGGPLGKPARTFCEMPGGGGAGARIRAGCELELCNLFQDAEKEYDAALAGGRASNGGGDPAASIPGGQAPSQLVQLRLSEIAMRRGDRPAAIADLKAALPSYLGAPIDSLPKAYWEILYPRPDWDAISDAARARGLDPALVCGLILQESAFNPLAVSQAGAIGLMQVLPDTGSDAARALGIKGYSPSRLIEPAINVRLGTWHFSGLLGRFNRRTELALAAYNAGEARVHQWQSVFGISDSTEFIEEVPFTETRLYVKRILSHAAMYKAIYGP